MSETAKRIIDGISELIMQSAQRLDSEMRHPNPDADRSEELIIGLNSRVGTLRDLREQFEDAMARVV